MKVYVLVKISSNKNQAGTTTGDIITVYPINVPQATLDINNFIYVVMDLNVPCGDNFRAKSVNEKGSHTCSRCVYNDYELCDVINYTRAVWGTGDIENPPEIISGRRFSIDREQFVSSESDLLVTNDDKTAEEKLLSFQRAVDNEQLKTIITEKVK